MNSKSNRKKKSINRKLTNIFNVDEEESIQATDEKHQLKNVASIASESIDKEKIESQWQKMLEQDPDVFSFDEIIEAEEADQSEIEQPLDQEEFKKPKYIHNLLQKAKERKALHDLAKEKTHQKELEKDMDEGLEVEQFITPSFKKKLEEKKALEEAERLKEIEEAKHSVEGKSNMFNFYQNLLENKTVHKKRPPPESDESEIKDVKKNKTT